MHKGKPSYYTFAKCLANKQVGFAVTVLQYSPLKQFHAAKFISEKSMVHLKKQRKLCERKLCLCFIKIKTLMQIKKKKITNKKYF